MAFRYLPPTTGALRQGEILGDIYEHVPRYPPIKVEEDQDIDYDSIHHEMLVVMSPDCDLEWDFKARFPDQQSQEQLSSQYGLSDLPKSIPHVFLAEIYESAIIQETIESVSRWDRIKGYQDQRYHYFEEAPVGETLIYNLPNLIIDFKKALAIRTTSLYEGIRVDGINRLAIIPEIYVHHLMHRYYGFLSRVALPD